MVNLMLPSVYATKMKRQCLKETRLSNKHVRIGMVHEQSLKRLVFQEQQYHDLWFCLFLLQNVQTGI